MTELRASLALGVRETAMHSMIAQGITHLFVMMLQKWCCQLYKNIANKILYNTQELIRTINNYGAGLYIFLFFVIVLEDFLVNKKFSVLKIDKYPTCLVPIQWFNLTIKICRNIFYDVNWGRNILILHFLEHIPRVMWHMIVPLIFIFWHRCLLAFTKILIGREWGKTLCSDIFLYCFSPQMYQVNIK